MASMRTNVAWAFAGNLANTLSQFLMLVVIARVGTAELVGQYGFALALTAPVFLLAGMSLRVLQVTDASSQFSFSQYASLRLLGMAAALIGVAAIAVVVGVSTDVVLLVVALGFTKAVEGISDIVFGEFQASSRLDLVARSLVVKSASTVVVFSGTLVLTHNLVLASVAIGIVWSIRLITFDLPNLMGLWGRERGLFGIAKDAVDAMSRSCRDMRALVLLVGLAIPTAITASVSSLSINVPRYVLEWSHGSAELGVFTTLAYPLVAGDIVASAVSQAALPRLAHFYWQGDMHSVRALMNKLMLIALGLSGLALVAASTVGPYVIGLLFGPHYAGQRGVFLVLVGAMGIGFLNWFLNAVLQSARTFRALMHIQVAALVVQCVLSLLLVPRYGLAGGAWSMVGTGAIQALGKYLWFRRGAEGVMAEAVA